MDAADPGRLVHAPLAATGGLPRRIVRAPALKRLARSEVPLADRIRLERVLGVTVGSNAAVDCSPSTGLVAYPAGCTVVLFNPRRNRQAHILNTSKKSITSLRFSSDGQYLVTGECGRQPAVRVWDVEQRSLLQEFLVHKYGITCVGFSPGNKYVVSVGFQHDMIVNVWDWQRNVKVASNKVSSRVKAVSFAENGSYFVTVGNRHVKFWYLELSRSSKLKEAVPLTGRSAILGEQRNNYFCDVSCGRGDMGDSTFAITRSGLLCEFNNRRLLDKWVELRTDSAYCMTAGEQLIFIGCSDGIVRCFSPVTLQFVTTLPRTHYLGVDVARGLNISHMASHPAGSRYPDCVGVSFDESSNKVTCFYNDHSVYVWDVRDIRKVGKSLSFLYHSACIWGVETYPSSQQPSSMVDSMPAGTFVTCSSDDTVRLWNLEPAMPDDSAYKRNIYSNDLLKILYMDPSLQYIKDVDQGSRETNGADKSDPSYDCKNGVRCIKISPDGRLLASGDRQGNVRVHDLHSLEEQCKIEAHDAEVLCLEYSRPDTGYQLLASASRDRLIHLFSVDQDCRFVQTLDDHSSSITAVRFFQHQERAFMVSCGADKSVIFREAVPSGSGELQFALSHNVVGKTTLYDIEVDHSQRHILTACQDRNIRVYNVANGKHSKTFRGSVGDDGTLIKLALDQSGIYVATSCTDKTLSVYDYYSGECMATMFGHSELVTGLRFTNDCRHLISVSGDGCVFIWRVPHDMQQTMCARLQQQARRGRRRQTQSVPPIVPPTVGTGGVRLDGGRQSAVPLSSAFSPDPSADPGYDSNANERDLSDTDYKFSIGKLPQWAKKKVKEQAMSPTNERPIDFPKGRWAQRVDTGGLTVKSIYDTDSVIPFPVHDSLRSGSVPDSEGSKDSSLEETRRISDKSPTLRYRQPVEARNRHIHDDSSDIGSYRLDEGTTDHDGDIDDYSEPESTENDVSEAPMYYPTPISDETAGAQYTVNAMDQEELRRSVRRYRRPRPARLLLAPSTTGSAAPSVGSPAHDESDEDFIIDEEEDEVSTPSAETDGGGGGKKMSNTLSTSMESLDQATRQERFLTKNFESLNDGPLMPATPISETPNGKASISSQFHGRAVQLGLARSQESLRKREELQRRIQETRRKLQHIGYKPTMRGSQSVCDLSSSAAVTIAVTSPQGSTAVGGASRRARAVSGELTDSGVVVGAGGGSAAVDYGGPDAGTPVDHGGADGGLRRAVSLSDLTDANAPRRVLPAPPLVSGRKPASSRKSRSSMARSSSMNSLNQGMPECGSASTVVSGRVARAGGGAMRPTIASMNKQRGPITAGVNQLHRRPLSGSASVSDVRIPDPDSSSEDPLSPIEWRSPAYSARNGTVATINGRLRTGSISGPSFDPGHHGRDSVTSSVSGGGTARSVASGVTVTKTRQQTVTKRQTVTLQGFDVRGSSPETDWDILDVDVNTLPLTREVCEAMTAALQRSSENVLLLQRRLMSADCSVPDEAVELSRLLGGGVTQALSTLRALQVPPAALKLPPAGVPLDPQASASNPAVLQMMQQYSDALITMMQQRIQQPNSNPPG